MKTQALIGISGTILFFALWAHGADENTYLAPVDKSLTIHKVGVLPATDNKGGLYSRYVEEKIRDKVKKNHRFDFRELKESNGRLSIDDYQEEPQLIKKAGQINSVDAIFAAKVNKTPQSLTVTVDLFLTSDGKLVAAEELNLPSNAGTEEVQKKTEELVDKTINKIPYKGLILSREGNRVTIDLGSKDGLRENSVISAAAIVSVKRHPKFNFIVSNEKEILGKIRIVKADDTLSFGLIIQEQERGIIKVDSKITGFDFISYPETQAAPPVPEVANDEVSFGKNPQVWNPKKPPGLGKVGIELGLGELTNSVTTQALGSLSSQVSVYPQLNVTGQLWLTPRWFVEGRLEQGIMSISNPLGGSNPSSLSGTNSHYALDIGHKFLLEDDPWGPQIELHLGAGKYAWFVDASTPTAFTSLSYYGLYFGLGGSIPVDKAKMWTIDATINRYFNPGQAETPVTTGSTTNNSSTEFTIGGSRRMSDSFAITGHLDFEFYSTTYTGQGTRQANGASDTGQNSSHTLFTLLGGIAYFF